MKKQKIAILTSGGDAPGMNAAIRAVTRKGLYHGLDILGVEKGYQGLIDGNFMPMQLSSVAGIINHGGTILRTGRSEAFKTVEGQELAIVQIKRQDIGAVVVIGGDGSMQGAKQLAALGINTVVIPASIDNDMRGTEYCIGFDTALNTIVEATSKVRDTMASHDRVAIVEVMGRSSGQLALMSGIACGAEVILVPEMPLAMEKICAGLLDSAKRGKLYSIIMLAEGVGKGHDIAEQISKRTKFPVRVTVLGYIQRGGSPTATDNIMGSKMGAMAIEGIIKGKTNFLVALRNGNLNMVSYGEEERFQLTIDRNQYELAQILAM